MSDPTDAPSTIEVSDDLVIEMYPGGWIDNRAFLIIRNPASEATGEEDFRVVVFLEEARSLTDALAGAAVRLAVHQVQRSFPELCRTGHEESHDETPL